MVPGLVSVVIPYLGEPEILVRCLEALTAQTHPRIEVIIIDNGTEELALHRQLPTPIRVIRNSRNVGFAGAVNQGYRACSGEYLLALNTDAFLESAYVEHCLVEMSDPKVAGVTGKLLKLGDRKLIDSTGHTLFGDRRVADRGEWEPDTGQYEIGDDVFSIPATAALYRMDALADVAASTGEVFDESFFMYGEDVDVAWRLRNRGWRLRYVPQALGSHRRAASGSRTPTNVVVWDWRNRLLRMVKNDSMRSVMAHWWEIMITELRLTGYYLVTRPAAPFRAWGGFVIRLPSAIAKRRRIKAAGGEKNADIERWYRRYDYREFLRRG